MKRLIVLFIILQVFAVNFYAVTDDDEAETTQPIYGIEVVRKVGSLILEDKEYNDVVMTFKGVRGTGYGEDKVKVIITNSKGKKIWKETLYNLYLYVFSDGQIKVAQKNFLPVLIFWNEELNEYCGMIKEKEGVTFPNRK